MKKPTPQEEKHSAELLKKDNLRFANLWRRTILKTARTLKTAAAETGK